LRNAEVDTGNVNVVNVNVVTVRQRPAWGEKAEAGKAARSAPGVNTVRNEIMVVCL
jgi:hypothetical protein